MSILASCMCASPAGRAMSSLVWWASFGAVAVSLMSSSARRLRRALAARQSAEPVSGEPTE
jgi:hypothetical protein